MDKLHTVENLNLSVDPLEAPDPRLEPFKWTTLAVIQSLFFGAVILGTILGNSTVLIAFFKYKRDLRSPTHIFLANLALTDLLVGSFSLPYLAVRTVTLRWYFGDAFCFIWTIGHFTFCSSSILSTLCVCVERFIGVRYPLRHLRILSTRKVLLIIACSWVLALSLSAVPILVWPETPSERPLDCKTNFRLGHVLFASVGIFHIPATLMAIFYWLIYRTVHQGPIGMSISNRRAGGGGGGGSAADEQRAKEMKLAKKLSFLVGFLILSYIPMFTIFLILGFKNDFVPLVLFMRISWIRYFNSCINPFIYAFSVPAYKRAFRRMFTGKSEQEKEKSKSNPVSTGQTQTAL